MAEISSIYRVSTVLPKGLTLCSRVTHTTGANRFEFSTEGDGCDSLHDDNCDGLSLFGGLCVYARILIYPDLFLYLVIRRPTHLIIILVYFSVESTAAKYLHIVCCANAMYSETHEQTITKLRNMHGKKNRQRRKANRKKI